MKEVMLQLQAEQQKSAMQRLGTGHTLHRGANRDKGLKTHSRKGKGGDVKNYKNSWQEHSIQLLAFRDGQH